MNLIEQWVKLAGLAAVATTMGIILVGVWRGLRRPRGQVSGREVKILRSRFFYILASLGYFELCYLIWIPFPLEFSPTIRVSCLILGGTLFFSGLALVLWGRSVLGEMYNVSSSLGASLFANHQLITRGPYRFVRHPMYLGILLTGLGGVMVYRTWTFVFVTITFLGLIFRARREEQALAAEFDEQWKVYCEQAPAWIPRLRRVVLPDYQAALIKIGVMFLPAIPAYLWMWSNVDGTSETIAQVVTYAYFIAGSLWIGMRYWNLAQLGVSSRGVGLSLGWGSIVILARILVSYSVDWPLWIHPITLWGLTGDIIFYVALVGLGEELLFRGLIYRALNEWNGPRLAIWGSSLAFGLYHLGGQGPLGAVSGMITGLILAVIRWRAGGIAGLILVHGLIDISAKMMLPAINPKDFTQPEIIHPVLLILGYALLLAVPIYLWKFYPKTSRSMVNSRAG